MINQTSKILAIMLYLVQIFINFKYGPSIAKVSNTLNLDITPSNWVFSIWLIIYSFQLYMLLGLTNSEATKIFIPHAFSVLFNVSWILAFTNLKLGLATIFILGLLASIIYVLINNKTNKNKTVKNFYSLYFGWISIASFISATGWIVDTLGIKFNQILAFILYTIFIFSVSSLNLFNIIPYALVYFDLIFIKKSLTPTNIFNFK
jgi:hypothetical protein